MLQETWQSVWSHVRDAHSLHLRMPSSSVPRTVHHVRDVQRQHHKRGDPRNTPEVRLMMFNRESEGFIRGVFVHCVDVPHHWVFYGLR